MVCVEGVVVVVVMVCWDAVGVGWTCNARERERVREIVTKHNLLI